MSRKDIEVRKCDRCGEVENFDETSRACERKKLWHEVMQMGPRERAHDLCPRCGTNLDKFLAGVICDD